MYSTARASRSNVNPAPVRSTVVLFDGGARRVVPNFGRGILRSLPTHRLPCQLDDLQWASQAFAAEMAGAEFDRLADEAAFLDRYCSGYSSL
jgi:hypothetical protein